ncbi:MAG: polyprenyl synthetase family protein [Caldimicrobium sp.]
MANLQDLKAYLEEKKNKIDETLKKILPISKGYGRRVIEAAHYSLFNGGKRLRPILCLMGYELSGKNSDEILIFAAGLECIHTYSLIHDDLPCMDDDDFRRGKPSCHKAFDEATAILAGDGLQALAYECFTHKELLKKLNPVNLLKAINLISKASGFKGMVGGQMEDLLAEGKKGSARRLKWIHEHKTMALIEASLVSGAILADLNKSEIKTLSKFGQNLGLLFQITDDLLDILGDENLLGKPLRSDLKKKKLTYPALFGIEKARSLAEDLAKTSIKTLTTFGERAALLKELIIFILNRVN